MVLNSSTVLWENCEMFRTTWPVRQMLSAWGNTTFEWILYWERRTPLKAWLSFYDDLTPSVWFPLLLCVPWMSLSCHSTLIVPPCVTTAVQKTMESCKNHQAPVISFCWHTVKVFNSSPVLFFVFFFGCCFTVQKYWLKQANKNSFVSVESCGGWWIVNLRLDSRCPKYWNFRLC